MVAVCFARRPTSRNPIHLPEDYFLVTFRCLKLVQVPSAVQPSRLGRIGFFFFVHLISPFHSNLKLTFLRSGCQEGNHAVRCRQHALLGSTTAEVLCRRSLWEVVASSLRSSRQGG